MASPFQVFRKNQKVLTVCLVGLAMFAFVILSSIQKMNDVDPALIVLILAILFAFVGWAVGFQQEKKTKTKGAALNYAMYFALGGAVIGVAMKYFTRELPAVTVTSREFNGSLTSKELSNLREKRVLSNRFMVESLRAVKKKYVLDMLRLRGMDSTNSSFATFKKFEEQQFERMVNQPIFSFYQDPKMDAVTSWLLNKEADQMGLEVSDEVVNEFILKVTRNLLTGQDVFKIRTEMKLSRSRLFDILREQIRASIVFRMKEPQPLMTPGDFGKRFRQLNVREELEIAKIPVSEFLKFVPEPKEDELRAYFDSHKIPKPIDSPSYVTSFFQPRKVKVAYLKASWEKVEKSTDKNHAVTDADVKKHYLENRDTKYLNPSRSRAKPFPSSEDIPTLNKNSSDDSKDGMSKMDDGKTSLENRESGLAFVSYQDSQKKKKSQTTSQKKQKSAAKTSPKNSKKKTETKQTVRVKQPPPPPLPVPPPPTKYLPLDNLLKEQIRLELRNERITKAMKDRIEKAKSWLLKNVEKPYISKRSDPENVTFDVQAISKKAKDYALAHDFEYTVTELLSSEEFLETGKFELSEGWEGYTGENDFNSAPKGSSSVAILFNPIPEKQKTEASFYHISRSIVKRSRNRFLFWKVDDILQHVPLLEDEGIREKVLTAWKLSKARELSNQEKKDHVSRKTAFRRAEELAEIVRKSGSSMSEALLGTPVSEDADSALIEIPPNTDTFAWKRLTPDIDPGTGRQRGEPQLKDSTIRGIATPPGVGEEFFETVFEKLKDGEVGVAFNADKSVYYVVRVLNRTPASEEGEQELLNRFLKEKLFGTQFDPYPTTYTRLQQNENNEIRNAWMRDFQRKYIIQFNTDSSQ